MEDLAKEISEVIVSSRITNITDNMDDVIDILQKDETLFDEVENLLTRDDIVWVNKNNNKIYFEVSFENDYPKSVSSKILDLDTEIKWIENQLNKDENDINWENIKYRYKRALKELGFKNVTYYQKVREIILTHKSTKWRFLNNN
ncbi:hypothetical protein CPU12_07675 [Malaciobacter molluscorum LMG 25693]|uniref:Uncharacterized protein n=1 Tax=Malaciobacter molluscorum LMG 25693 TaxID=870501 RepID=A0A2G1DHI8_9BACT|nr:hypothetical protein [Malaciobacter molluscorum]AXX93312.1 hypothetical protein AMOL_2370 [Malaciobacter molluscorum LMG 25693]PHO17968.1 hypothetical protein CPU12_07675 [Malaciobacter molluscorum LMG 25693]RXJ95170.1 hypothetical protein CRV00_05295 [Malaciobacter molluscorum]